MKAVVIGSDLRLGLELAANLQGRDYPFVSIASYDPVLDSARLLQHAFTVHRATEIVSVLPQEWFGTADSAVHRRGLLLIKNLCSACRTLDIALIHISDASMFAGRKNGAYREKDKPDCGDERARRVLKGESYVVRRVPRHIVLRSGPLFAAGGNNLFTEVMRHLEKGLPLECGDDKICPTPANDLARVVVAIILQLSCGATPWGVYQYCCSDAASLYNFAEAVVALASQYGRIPADGVDLLARPVQDRNVVLNCHKLLGAFGIKQRAWRAALPSVVAEYCR